MIQLNDIKSKLKANSLFLPFYVLAFLMLASCAKMGQPDGGWFDETPPKVIGASPADKGVNVKQKKVNIYFDEYIKVDNPTEKVETFWRWRTSMYNSSKRFFKSMKRLMSQAFRTTSPTSRKTSDIG